MSEKITESYLLFSLREKRFALPTNTISRVIRNTEITNVPKMPKTILGIASFRSQIFVVIDLGKCFNWDTEKNNNGFVILLENFGKLVGVMAHNILGITNLCQNQIKTEKNGSVSFINRKFIHDGKNFLIIDPHKLIEEQEFLTFAKL